MTSVRYAFTAEWLDSIASIVRKYIVCFYPDDNSVEMIDAKTQRMFLRRTKVGNQLGEFFLGNSVNVCSRQLKILDYADNFTRKELGSRLERTLMIVKPDCVSKVGEVLEIVGNEFTVAAVRMVQLSASDAREFYAEHAGREFFDGLCAFMTSGSVVALELVGDNAISRARTLIGPTDSAQARREAKTSIRARFGTDNRRNAVHGSDSAASAARELQFFFGAKRGNPTSTLSSESVLCLIKPHVLMDGGTAGAVLQAITTGGYTITALQSHVLDKATAEEFLEVYKGVVAEYASMVDELVTGPVLAVEVSGNDARSSFRPFCGPADPTVAKHLYPRTLRALFGKNKVQNAVHCTDLAEDIPLELEYFFQLL